MVVQEADTPQPEPKLADQDARDAISGHLDDTLFVEASAGTGKTASLVARVVNLVSSGQATLDRIAAITFTEAAAAELRIRIRQQLELAGDESSRSPQERHRCLRGVADLDQAAISTLHAFAALILHERPLEAGLPPAFDTSDEIASRLRFNEEWDAWLDRTLDLDSPLADSMTMALSLGLTLPNLKDVAHRFHINYIDLEAVPFPSPTPATKNVAAPVADSLSELQRLCQYSRRGPGDPLYDHVQGKLSGLRRLVDAEPGSPSSWRLLSGLMDLKCGKGNQGDWNTDPLSGQNACKSLKDLLGDLHETFENDLSRARRDSLLPLLEGIRLFVLDYALRRRAEGRAEFHDLLIWARELLRDNIEVRDHFQRRFSHLLIDEAQDTDPLQAEIAMFLAESVSAGIDSDDRPRSWDQVTPGRGRLFVVGDPKQSIYRFRRADVGQMRRLQERMEHAGGSTVSLVQNFRSQDRLVSWVNHVFSQWMPGVDDVPDGDAYLQAKYEAMHPQRTGDGESPVGPQVWALANDNSGDSIDPVRRDESRGIATLLQQIVSQPWMTLDREASGAAGHDVYRPVTYSDICILMPRRTSLPELEREWEDRNIPYRLESASLVFQTQEIRDLLNCLRSIDDPANLVATVAALRSPALGCSDVDLLQHREAGGSFNYMAGSSGQPQGPVSDALQVLRKFHGNRTVGSVGSLIDGFLRERMLMEVAVDHPRMREQWRRYRFMVEQAWQFAAVAGNSLRAFVQWMEEQVSGRSRVNESAVQESDEEAVRVMTVHSSKGLEFPVVILAGINSTMTFRAEKAYFDRERGRADVSFSSAGGGRFETDGFRDLADFEKRMFDAENVRLMYVATTRARDHLVLSLRRPKGGRGANSLAGRIAKFMEGAPELWTDVVLLPPATQSDAAENPDAPDSDEHSVEARDRWLEQRQALVDDLRRRTTVAATALGHSSTDPRPSQLDADVTDDKPEPANDEPWRKGRAGSDVGRAVHAVLQTIDLATGDGIEDRAKAQAVVEGVADRLDEVVRYSRAAVDSNIVKRAVASRRLWREVPVALGIGNGSLHGFIDLLFEEDDSLVVVDYKTDSISPGQTATAVQRYRLQGGAYAHAIQEVTGKKVKEVVFLYLNPQREVPLPDLQQAIIEARSVAEEALT